ncbi:MAG: threonine synthase [Gaiellaceae bacterium MAG52_C11]|nr:threonine synthase [Candidatus Gaiellasilicea maunaloa]
MSGTSLRCRVCERELPLAPVSACPACHGPVDVAYDLTEARLVGGDGAPRSMWRYSDLLPHPPADLDTPGLTPLVAAPRLSEALGIELLLKLEDANPTHSFKDRIAATAVASARAYGFSTVCCASTGNLAEAIAARCAANGLEAVVLCPRGDLPLVPVPAYGARVFGVSGGFDDCRELEQQLESLFPWGFVGGNLHAVAAEGAKTIAYEIFEQLGASLPDAIVSPAASGMLVAKLAQGFAELGELGLWREPPPRLYAAQAGGCPPLASAWADDRPLSRVRPATEVRSLAIGDPVYGELAVGAARVSGGSIVAVPEEEIAARTAFLAELSGVFADSAGGVAVGALLDLVRSGAIAKGDRVVLVVTGSGLKPYGYGVSVTAEEVDFDVDAVLAALGVAPS